VSSFSQLHESSSKEKVTIEDFSMIRVVGRGAYGKVYKAKFIRDSQLYAVKAMKKDFLVKGEQVYRAILE
jgi:serine/threonine protein kinase